jgi:hypothetical protein
VECESRHLREVAHRDFARVVLPVSVCGEADGRVERQIGRDGVEPLWIEWQQILQALDAIGDKGAGQAEQQ